mmetsp:Transcript_24359/g.43206  ORF Transcript_24359/g.43206 Transcript_24359/m.43206 type:complete len:528 (-) Transcript_24359:242-1825(-)|eukprot:CAMPEP_0197522714 /NCGR_PEP_ID=MMETSP1318-20131121/7801_1 /TAXON_ID=552666 /ORGANISM="Partenskyella glossopodia, Strain RCC365" /LENGTH=527 /DNA_ID=CAMNT_0043075177 /DNA_START=144 /DNA_END=1727 /DNA_ORIENTATION=+
MGRKGKSLNFSALMRASHETLSQMKGEGIRSVVSEFSDEWKKVEGQLEAVEALKKNVDVPQDVEEKITKIKADMTKFYRYVQTNYGLEDGARGWSWLSYIPIAKPAITTLAPAACFYLSMDKWLPVYLMATVTVIFIIWTVREQWVVDFVNAWRGTHDAEVERYCKRLRSFYDVLRDFAALQNQLRKARTFDVRSILEHDHSARQFWIKHFGASKHSVQTPQMIEALLHVNHQTHMVGKQTIQLVYNTIANIIDKNNDGFVSPIELLDFLKYFGPVRLCVTRIKDSLIDTPERGASSSLARRYPWFTWRSMDRQEAERLFSLYGSTGDFVVRCSSKGGFAITYMESKQVIRHIKIYYEANAKAENGVCKPFHLNLGNFSRSFPNLSALVRDMHAQLRQPFMDPETVAHFSVCGQYFQVQAKLFTQKKKFIANTFLGQYFDTSSDESRFPRGEFWNSDAGHSKENPIFLDRDPSAFNVILNWYRYYGKLYVPEEVSAILMEKEVQFFQLPVTCTRKTGVNGEPTVDFS